MMLFTRKKEQKSAPPSAPLDSTDAILGAILGETPNALINQSYSSQVRLGLQSNPYVLRCVELRANAIASLDPILIDSDKQVIEDPNHPLSRLLRAPSKGKTWRDLVHQVQVHLALNGNAYIYVVKTVKGIEELLVIPPDCITALPSGNILHPVRSWQISTGSGTSVVDPGDVIHIHAPLDIDGIRGISPLESAAQSIAAQTEAREWNTALMRNGAKPSAVVSTPEVMTPQTFQKFKEKLRLGFSGTSNAGNIMLLDGGKTATFDGFNARDMDYSAGITLTAREITLALGVPPELAGDSANKTYSNAQEAHKEFAVNTISPLATQFFDALSLALCPEGSDVSEITYDKAQIEGMKSDESALISALTSCDFLSDNEKRARLSYDAIPDGDVILTGMGKVPRSEIVSDPLEMANDNRESL